jgi:SAM-dependent methyltransferase
MRHVWEAMQTELLRGVPMSDAVGGGDPKLVASMMLGSIDCKTPIPAGGSVLDLGCGCGRISLALAERGGIGNYIGIDIVPGLIEFAQRHITTAYPHFRFYVLDQVNHAYDFNIEGRDPHTINNVTSVVKRQSIDVCIAVSLFTHLDVDDAKTALRAIARGLKQDGKLFMTCFIIDEVTQTAIADPRIHTPFSFQHRLDSGAFTERQTAPTFAVAFTHAQLTLMSSVKHRTHDWDVLHACQREVD